MPVKPAPENRSAQLQSILEDFPGVEKFEVVRTDEGIRLVPLRPVEIEKIERIRERVAERGLTESDVRDAVKWARRQAD